MKYTSIVVLCLMLLACTPQAVSLAGTDQITENERASVSAGFVMGPGNMTPLADQYVRDLEAKLQTLETELDEWKSGAMADATGHMFRCAKVNGVWQCAKGCPQHELADKEICIVTLEQLVLQLDKVHDAALKRIKVLEDAVGGPILK